MQRCSTAANYLNSSVGYSSFGSESSGQELVTSFPQGASKGSSKQGFLLVIDASRNFGTRSINV